MIKLITAHYRPWERASPDDDVFNESFASAQPAPACMQIKIGAARYDDEWAI